ncbi:glycosyltransferase family 2 protein [Methylobacterium sp. A52T]
MYSTSTAENIISGQKRPVLAIIINCFNYERYVHCAIQSVVSQNNRSCEIVVVDDGSTDQSWAVIQSSGVRSFRKTNGGQVSACLLGLDNTVAPFVLFLDADDQLLPNSLAVIIRSLDADIAKLQFPLARIDEAGSMIAPAFPSLLKDGNATDSRNS